MSLTIVPIVARPRDVPLPKRATYHAWSCLHEVSLWLRREVGKTFTVGSPVSWRDTRTWAEIGQVFPPLEDNGYNIWRDAYYRASASFGPTPTKVGVMLYLRPPKPVEHIAGFGGMVGHEDYGWARPGHALCGDAKAWLMCGKTLDEVRAMGWNPPWWGDERSESIGSIAHEVVHMLVDAPHTKIDGDVLSDSYDRFPNCYIQPDVKEQILASGYL
jgi:hypothetical protein